MLSDTISLKGLPSGRYTGVINLIDIFSQYSWQIPVQTVGSASEAAAAINLAMKRIKERFDLPSSIELQADNGLEFKQSFANSLDDSAITVTHGPAFSSLDLLALEWHRCRSRRLLALATQQLGVTSRHPTSDACHTAGAIVDFSVAQLIDTVAFVHRRVHVTLSVEEQLSSGEP